ncbi:MAG: glycosyltransferase family 2 protein, partial [Gammaproteobacteria bacterium]|nr:glycosyltransferase family 2 protein [Gammaproteobacteria bacterium]
HQQRLRTVQNLSAVTAACLLVRKSIYQEVGGLEEDLQVAFNDVDFCLKVLQHGYRNVFTPDAELYHYESKSRGKEDTPSKKAREQREIQYMRQKWPAIIAEDPCYNPNLSRLREDFSLDIDEALP